jgi:hypothetical protein
MRRKWEIKKEEKIDRWMIHVIGVAGHGLGLMRLVCVESDVTWVNGWCFRAWFCTDVVIGLLGFEQFGFRPR